MLLEEPLADFEEEAKGHAAAEGGIGDDEEGEAACGWMVGVVGWGIGDVMDLVLPVGIGEFLRTTVFNLG